MTELVSYDDKINFNDFFLTECNNLPLSRPVSLEIVVVIHFKRLLAVSWCLSCHNAKYVSLQIASADFTMHTCRWLLKQSMTCYFACFTLNIKYPEKSVSQIAWKTIKATNILTFLLCFEGILCVQ